MSDRADRVEQLKLLSMDISIKLRDLRPAVADLLVSFEATANACRSAALALGHLEKTARDLDAAKAELDEPPTEG